MQRAADRPVQPSIRAAAAELCSPMPRAHSTYTTTPILCDELLAQDTNRAVVLPINPHLCTRLDGQPSSHSGCTTRSTASLIGISWFRFTPPVSPNHPAPAATNSAHPATSPNTESITSGPPLRWRSSFASCCRAGLARRPPASIHYAEAPATTPSMKPGLSSHAEGC